MRVPQERSTELLHTNVEVVVVVVVVEVVVVEVEDRQEAVVRRL